jgi:nucleotide-binding universal stress UspA family protein
VDGCIPALGLRGRRDAAWANGNAIGRIVVGYDGSDAARRALARAAALSGGKADVAVVAAARLSVSGLSVLPDPRLDQERDELLREANVLLRRQGIVAVALARRGDPAKEIVETAREIAADLIVIGSRRRGRVRRLLLGSVAGAVVREAACDVLVVR